MFCSRMFSILNTLNSTAYMAHVTTSLSDHWREHLMHSTSLAATSIVQSNTPS